MKAKDADETGYFRAPDNHETFGLFLHIEQTTPATALARDRLAVRAAGAGRYIVLVFLQINNSFVSSPCLPSQDKS